VLRHRHFIITFACLVLLAATSMAAPRDKAALKKIDEAISTHYLNMNFDQAEGLLLGTIRACEDRCSPQVVAKAWMYVGVVRGAGRNDLAGAQEAFTTALGIDANVKLDDQVATDPVKQAFEKAKGSASSSAPDTTPAPTPASSPSSAAFTCSLSATEVETRRPIPIQCETDAEVASARLFYKTFNGKWTAVTMDANAGAWRGTVPCAATGSTGALKYYVEGLSSTRDTAASFGTRDAPKSIDIASETTADPPAYPAEEPPARCSVDAATASTEPAATGGACGAWGEPCGADDCCGDGLTCTNGTCESAQCQSDSDCKNGGECVSGKCSGDEPGAPPRPYKKNWVGLHFGPDIATVSGSNVCTSAAHSQHYACFFNDGSEYPPAKPDQNGGFPNPNGAGAVNGGFTPTTLRLMASYERLFGPFGLEGRLGFAFNGGRTPVGGSSFLPVHVEARGKYWLLGTKAFGKKGFRPWVHVGGGIAEVDAVVAVQVADCRANNGVPGANVHHAAANCAGPAGGLPTASLATSGATPITLDAQKQLGTQFAELGGGVMYAIGENHGVVLNVNLMLMLPVTGFVFEPTIGYEVGF